MTNPFGTMHGGCCRYVSGYITPSTFSLLTHSHDSPTTLPLVALILPFKDHTTILSQYISPQLPPACSSVRKALPPFALLTK